MRLNNRECGQLRPVTIIRNYTSNPEGSVYIECGNTKLICTASVVSGVPKFLKDSGQGWVTAEYGMLPRATHTRTDREAARGKQTGRTMEIQRLIGRALRTAVNLTGLGENTITVDCDVIQADGGTRCAAITGGCIALYDAIKFLQNRNSKVAKNAFVQLVAAVSVGVCGDELLLDLDYREDSNADTDMNIIMTAAGHFVELQGTAEKNTFTQEQLNMLLELGKTGLTELFAKQTAALD